ncbi:MAG: hypothetical protein Q9201_002619 [Fulgogasparrea decipioides]
MPENLYFREPPTQAILLDTLFIYCKLNRDIGYRQGMHEVLAPILWVVSRDAIDVVTSGDAQASQSPEYTLLCECLDARYVEHDTFTLFCIIMQTVKSFYETGSTTQVTPSMTSSNSPIVERSRRIHEIYLHQADPELAEHLSAIEILPQIFLIRWIRLLFGREFPLDQLLALWDILFAEDPTLDLIDLVCVSMLLRIRWELLGADYSEALTLLLRFPVPPSPNGPSTFVSDALYLRQNLNQSGGAHIIHKYAERITGREEVRGRARLKSSRRSKQSQQLGPNPSLASGRSAVRAFQQHGGIENIIQEAAKGVYSRSEKWGLNKALRNAMEGLQSGVSSPQQQIEGSRWSLDTGTQVPSASKATSDIKALEQRSKALAKLLENAIEEFWLQQRQCNNEQEEVLFNALSLAIAKIQFVQVYLENPTMPFTTENPTPEPVPAEEHADTGPDESAAGTATQDHIHVSNNKSEAQRVAKQSPSRSHPEQVKAATAKGAPSEASAPGITVPKSRAQSAPFHHPRPSLAQSSFSWMLGEDQRKSSFVSPRPFPSDRRAAREKAGFLFGEDRKDPEEKKQKAKAADESEDEEVINLGTLK